MMSNKDRIILSVRTLLLIAVFSLFTGCSKNEVREINKENSAVEEEEKTEEIEQARRAEITDYLTVRETSYKSSDIVSCDTRYEYYDNGAYKSMIMELPVSGFDSGFIYIDYDRPTEPGNIEICKTYGNKVGESTIIDKGYYKVTYNSEWKVIRQEWIESNSSKPSEIITYSYDDKGNLLERITESDSSKMDTKYEYDEYNVLISKDEEIVTSRNSGSGHYSYSYEYDVEGLPCIRYEYLNGDKNSTTKIYRNEAGLICKEEITDSKGSVSYKEYERYLKEEYIDKFCAAEKIE